MRNHLFTLTLGAALALGVSSSARAQDNAAAQPQQQDQAQAQPGQGPGGPMRMDPDRQLGRMTRELGLTTDQQNQIKPLLVDRQQKIGAVFQDQSLSPRDRRAKMQSIRQDSRSRIEAVLNDQQKQKFEAMEQERGRRGGPGGPPDGVPQPQ